MLGTDRRKEIINILKNTNKAISGGTLADELKVSRQLIVGDIALLRASGIEIISTPKGYVLDNKDDKEYINKIIVCRHDKELIEDELNLIVDEGASILNVMVEHSVYGQIIGDLHISSRRDVKEFIKKLSSKDIEPLAKLTDGVHLHTIKYRDEKTLDNVMKVLKEKGYLYEC
ncbi:MAG: transcription repressor NadR [Peptostreptococcaceae bacterium]